MRICAECGTRSALSFAILPEETVVVCEQCFIKATGHSPLPAGDGLTLLGFHLGQYVKDPLPGADTQAAALTPLQVTIRGATVRGATVRGATVRGATITIRGVTIR